METIDGCSVQFKTVHLLQDVDASERTRIDAEVQVLADERGFRVRLLGPSGEHLGNFLPKDK
jgi:hypothetical protein